MRSRILLLGLTLSFGIAACSDDGDDGGSTGPPPAAAVRFSQDIQPVFTASCARAGCHGGTNPAEGMNLSAGEAYASIVNVASNELPSMDRIEPGDPDDSYLVNKIQGTQGNVGGSGERMPLGGGALPQGTIDLIRRWVSEGAANN